jgi:ATP-dependent helicase/nuclease subunit A
MTRAARRLVVCGAEGAQKRPDGCWYDLVRDALAPDSMEFDAEDGDGKVLRYRGAVPALDDRQAAAEKPRHPLPDWLARDVLPEIPGLISVVPSDFLDTHYTGHAMAATAAGRVKALARGRTLHRLMQSLPDLPPERRQEAARQYLARWKDFLEHEREEMLVQVLKVIGDPRFAPLFAPGSRAEVPIVGQIAVGKQGLQVDRLAVTDKEVLIADYKTNRPAPRRLDDVPAEYRRQLALYRAVLGRIYPRRVIRAAIIWTDLPELMEIPAARLDAELAPPAAA